MTENVKRQLEILRERKYRELRKDEEIDLSKRFDRKINLERAAIRLTAMLEREMEEPNIFPGERIGFNRRLKKVPMYTNIKGEEFSYAVGNITPNYGAMMEKGVDKTIEDILKRMKGNISEDQRVFYQSVLENLRASLKLAERYRDIAKEQGNWQLAEALEQIPHRKPENFHQACVFMKFIMFTLRCNDNSHMTMGRFDQYMYKYFKKDIDSGIPAEDLLECLEEFFISINVDTDLYHGIQQGDNGQSMVLGGVDKDGNDAFNELSELCMRASVELNLIDPKINLRVSKNTPMELYELGTELTKQGMGFPQYNNDDIVIPGLIKLGYEPEDAANYTVAACWEFIVPNCAMDIPNIVVMNFPKIVNDVIHDKLESCKDFEALQEALVLEIREECIRLTESCRSQLEPSPYLSVYIDACLEAGADLSKNVAKYNNSGCHGTGIANAADALAAVKKLVFEDKILGKRELLKALDDNFEGAKDVRKMLLDCPKMGNNEDFVDELAGVLIKTFSTYMNGRPNNRGGIFRAGTGSAMEYYLSAKNVPATADGRKAFDMYSSSFSPSLKAKLKGPLSILKTFTKYDLTEIINGGPLTLEIHDTTFRNQDGVKKVAALVKTFIHLGGHQLQLNAVNKEKLLDAQKHPEKYPNLIVRVWGWSGYFNELDLQYQNHVISRAEFLV